MKTILDTPFLHVTFEKNNSLIRFTYLEKTSQMTEEEFKEVMLTYVGNINILANEESIGENSLIYLNDLSSMFFPIAPELQEWVDREITSHFISLSKKSAVILPEGIFESVATQQTLDEDNASKVSTRYFEDKEEALKWLLA